LHQPTRLRFVSALHDVGLLASTKQTQSVKLLPLLEYICLRGDYFLRWKKMDPVLVLLVFQSASFTHGCHALLPQRQAQGEKKGKETVINVVRNICT